MGSAAPLGAAEGFDLIDSFFTRPGQTVSDCLGDSLSMALLDSLGVNFVVGVWDNLPPGVELFPVRGTVAEETLGVWTPLSTKGERRSETDRV